MLQSCAGGGGSPSPFAVQAAPGWFGGVPVRQFAAGRCAQGAARRFWWPASTSPRMRPARRC
eukprot:672785-Lingulodinium_polyedra.AAC.1